ncbi:tlde1 domain-containing protein [Paraburkholderia sp. CNPSo 3281]|uniref:tlde1 domain-containing protein n=1 Tax=Paraburkholderia sp. CNPSo 3281 TaxID=2940933 RepID=UPI0020B87531|nr:tlde1 domain-containing protein [Paraburkholderia sp. CNPSo 3281]MCP3719209.1 DUF2778 domain-containing protein [Paraburkholderia sp. CNPSo 3281]
MPIPAHLWLKDDGGADIKGSSTVDSREGSIEIISFSHGVKNTVTGIPSHHSEWFALYRDDGKIDDFTWVKGIERGHFRLHPAGGRGISLGCITLPSYADFARIRQALLHTPAVSARDSGLRAYGTIEVIAYGDTCP